MKKIFRVMSIIALAKLSLLSAFATEQVKTSKECVANLSSFEKQVYDVVAPYITASSDVEKVATNKIRAQVFSGKPRRKGVKKAAQSAGPCWVLLKVEKQAQ